MNKKRILVLLILLISLAGCFAQESKVDFGQTLNENDAEPDVSDMDTNDGEATDTTDETDTMDEPDMADGSDGDTTPDEPDAPDGDDTMDEPDTNPTMCDGGDPNACGGCEDLDFEINAPCGTCDSGTYQCDEDPNTVICEDDRGDAALNECGGCEEIETELNAACGTCDSGSYICDGTDAMICDGDLGNEAQNVCGGCTELNEEAIPGQACNGCLGQWTCDDTENIQCDETNPGNACGGCEILENVPDMPCGTCDTGSYICDGTDATVCDGDQGNLALNACGGCEELEMEIGTDCGTCGGGTWQCDGMGGQTCAGTDPVNACGGCDELDPDFEEGTTCGSCDDGTWTCTDDIGTCEGASDTFNACGGCAPNPEGFTQIGFACGTCNSGSWACNNDDVICEDDRGDAALNECGECSAPDGWVCVPSTEGFLMGGGEENTRTTIISTPYYMMTFEVTQELWESVTGSNPSRNNTCSTCPVEQITWDNAISFANALSVRDGYEMCYTRNGDNTEWISGLDCTGYRLPTEAEWEWAAKTDQNWYSTPPLDVAWYLPASNQTTHPVGEKEVNPFGLYDILGNVREMTWDEFMPYSTDTVTDPVVGGLTAEPDRVISTRGGSYGENGAQTNAHMRFECAIPSCTNRYIGIRLVRSTN